VLQAQFAKELDLWQSCHKIAKKSSKIVPLRATLIWSRPESDNTAYRMSMSSDSLPDLPNRV